MIFFTDHLTGIINVVQYASSEREKIYFNGKIKI